MNSKVPIEIVRYSLAFPQLSEMNSSKFSLKLGFKYITPHTDCLHSVWTRVIINNPKVKICNYKVGWLL